MSCIYPVPKIVSDIVWIYIFVKVSHRWRQIGFPLDSNVWHKTTGEETSHAHKTRPQPNQKQPVSTWDWFDCGGEQCGEYEPRTKHVRQRTTMDCRVEVPHRARKGESQRQDTLWAWVPRERSQLVHSRAEPSVTVSHLNRLKSC